jgi:hypothetical protein
VPSRRDLERLVVWCDTGATQTPFQWVRAELGAALTVHGMTPSGDVIGGIVAMWKGRIRMRATSGISEFPDEPVRFEGTLTGIRNPTRTVQLTPTANSDSLTVTLAGTTLPSQWSTRFDVARVVDTAGVVRADWTLTPANAVPTHLFELALWPDLGVAVDLGPP